MIDKKTNMIFESLTNDEDFFRWQEYEPQDIQYIRYAKNNPSVIAAGHKIADVFYAFADARASFIYAYSDDFGNITDSKEGDKLYARSHFLRYAVIEYALCLDMSWQVIWSYIQPASLEYLVKQQYKQLEKACTSEAVHEQLNCAIAQHILEAKEIKDLLTQFENEEAVIRLRKIYNSIKHHGTIHIKGLGSNSPALGITVDDTAINKLNRMTYSTGELETLLWAYHQKFHDYFNKLIALIMPDDYLNNTTSLGEAISSLIEMKEIQEV